MVNTYSNSVTPISTATNIADPAIPVGNDPGAIAITPDGKTAYVTNQYSTWVTPIDTATNTAGPPIQIGTGSGAIAMTPNGQTAYVAASNGDTVIPISTATNTPGPPVQVGSDPTDIAITPAQTPQTPEFTSAPADTMAFGAPSTFTVTTNGDPAPALTRTGRLPSGLHLAQTGNGTATISGTPANGAAGIYPLSLTAKNRARDRHTGIQPNHHQGSGNQEDPHYPSQDRGPCKPYPASQSAIPLPPWPSTGDSPSGLSFTDNRNGTAAISGTPNTGSGRRCPRMTITAANASGTATRRITILVASRRKQ